MAGRASRSAGEPTTRWRLSSGLELVATEHGPPGAAVVLLQHGGGQTRHAWKHTTATLGEAGYHAVAFDARGHGESDWDPDGDYTQDASVRDLVEVVDRLGDPHPVLVGASMGGGTSLVAVGEGHVSARALVLVDVAPRIEPDGARRIGDFMGQRPEGFDSLEEVAEAIARYQPHRSRPRDLAGLAKNVRLGEDGRYHWHWDPRFRVGKRDGEALARRRDRLEACARHLRIPTLLVRGALSDLLSEEGARDFLALCPHAEYVNVADAAHMVVGDRNDVFSRAVIDFLTRTVPADASDLPPARPRPGAPGASGLTDVP